MSITLRVIVVLSGSAAALGQTSQPATTFPNLDAGQSTPHGEPLRRVQSLALLLLISTLLFLVFVIAIYFLFRRRLEYRPARDPTRYVDAWSNYRLTESSIQAATAEEPGESSHRPPPRDDDDEQIWEDDSPDPPQPGPGAR